MRLLVGDWSRLNHLQVGRYAEQLVTMAFVLHGCDVYGCEVDDRGIDLIVRSEAGDFMEVQVKSARKTNYVFFPKDKFLPKPLLWAAVVRFVDGVEPNVYLIPSRVWRRPSGPFTSRDYEGRDSPAEWGLSFARKHEDVLAEFQFDRRIAELCRDTGEGVATE